jgi:hypothetical protein
MMTATAIREHDAYTLTKLLFGYDLPPGQVSIVRAIAFSEYKRISINAYTRYGKTFCVAIGVSMYILFNTDKKIAIIAPKAEQTSILRDYIYECIMRCPALQAIIDLDRKHDIEGLKKQSTKNRQTFSNGCEYRLFSAHGDAGRLMGFGANGIIIRDEAAKISREANVKIMRMLGDAPDTAIMVDITNPWDRDTTAYDHWVNPNWKTIYINWKQVVKEGRTTQQHIDEMRDELKITPMDFEVLYESNYPQESEDSLIRFAWVQNAIETKIVLKEPKVIYGLDVAEMGRDFTVLTRAEVKDNKYNITNIWKAPKSDTWITSKWVMDRVEKDEKIHVDAIGVGAGVYADLKHAGYNVYDIKVGRSPTTDKFKDIFVNQKAEFYWKLRNAFEESRIHIPLYRELKSELIKMRYEKTLSAKTKIIDPPEKSPDFADSLMLLFAEGSRFYITWSK